jgi:hypothetical protein
MAKNLNYFTVQGEGNSSLVVRLAFHFVLVNREPEIIHHILDADLGPGTKPTFDSQDWQAQVPLRVPRVALSEFNSVAEAYKVDPGPLLRSAVCWLANQFWTMRKEDDAENALVRAEPRNTKFTVEEVEAMLTKDVKAKLAPFPTRPWEAAFAFFNRIRSEGPLQLPQPDPPVRTEWWIYMEDFEIDEWIEAGKPWPPPPYIPLPETAEEAFERWVRLRSWLLQWPR